jgi:L,D-transpeptidase-like protein
MSAASRRLTLVLAVLVCAAALPSLSVAAESSARRADARVKLEVGGLDNGTALPNSHIPISGALAPFRAHERVEVQIFHDGRLDQTRKLRVHRGEGNFGVFKMHYFLGEDVHYGVRVVHPASRRLGKDASALRKFELRFPDPGYGECGPDIEAFKKSLQELGFVPGDGPCWGDRTSRAVLAYRKTNDMTRNYEAGVKLFRDAFNGIGGYHVKHTAYGKHVEIDISRQILVLIDAAGEPALIYPVSTGKSSTPTVKGHFTAYGYRNPGYNSHGMFWSVYFYGGYAIHGYADVPTYPASHGCVRTPIPDAHRIYKWIDDGDDVFVNS